MLAHDWYEQRIPLDAIDGRSAAAPGDNDEALDDWLASLSVNQLERILGTLMEHLGGVRPALNQLA